MDINQLNRAYVEQYYIEQYEKDLIMNKKHKHAELIKAWADGAEIESWSSDDGWRLDSSPSWSSFIQYRIKPEPKPDVVLYGYAEKSKCEWYATKMGRHQSGDNLKLTFDGETGELKSAEVLK